MRLLWNVNYSGNTLVSENYYNPKNVDLFCESATTLCDIGLVGTDNGLYDKMTGETVTFTMGINYNDSIDSNGTFHLLDDEEKLQLTINEIFAQDSNFHWVDKRYQFMYKSIATNLYKEFNYEIILLKDLTQFLKNEFNVDKVPNIENFGHPNFTPAYVTKLLKSRRYDNIKKLVDMCFIERYYYYLLKDGKIKINFLHDSIFY